MIFETRLVGVGVAVGSGLAGSCEGVPGAATGGMATGVSGAEVAIAVADGVSALRTLVWAQASNSNVTVNAGSMERMTRGLGLLLMPTRLNAQDQDKRGSTSASMVALRAIWTRFAGLLSAGR